MVYEIIIFLILTICFFIILECRCPDLKAAATLLMMIRTAAAAVDNLNWRRTEIRFLFCEKILHVRLKGFESVTHSLCGEIVTKNLYEDIWVPFIEKRLTWVSGLPIEGGVVKWFRNHFPSEGLIKVKNSSSPWGSRLNHKLGFIIPLLSHFTMWGQQHPKYATVVHRRSGQKYRRKAEQQNGHAERSKHWFVQVL